MAKRILVAMRHGGSYWGGVARGAMERLRLEEACEFVVQQDPPPRGAVWDGLVARVSTPGEAAAFSACRCPVVNVSGRFEGLPFPAVLPDDAAIGRMAASHLMRLGLRRFAFFGDGTAFSTRRGGAFRAALASRGIGCLMSDEVLSPQADIGEAVGSPGGRPLGVFCCNDDRADAIAAFCLAMGLRIPDDAGVLGAENVDTVILRCPVPLSSIEIPTFEIGFRAAELLLGMLGGARAPSRPVLVPPLRVVVRRSTDVLAVDDPAVRRALRFIRAKGHTDVNVENVWRASGLSRRALEKRFRDELRSTIHEELAAYRHDRAKELLGSTGLPVSEVASRSGFNSHAWFARAFREREGTSPTEYRARARTPR